MSLQNAVDSFDYIRLAPLEELDEPLILPDRPIVIEGDGMSEIRFTKDGGIYRKAETFYNNSPLILSNFIITNARANDHDAIKLEWPEAHSIVGQQALIEKVKIRPTYLNTKSFWGGVSLTHAWNVHFDNCEINGPWGDIAIQPNMKYLIDCHDSMCIRITNLNGGYSYYGVHSDGSVKQGRGEGIRILGGDLVNVNTGYFFEGKDFGYPTPHCIIENTHVFSIGPGAKITGRSDIHIRNNSFCHSFHAKEYAYLLELAFCESFHISDNTFWAPNSSKALGIALGACERGVINSNTIDPNLHIGVWFNKCKENVLYGVNANDAVQKTVIWK